MPRKAKKKPNILLIAVDSLRRDHMSCYGYPKLTTPHIDAFAKQATLFEETFSPHVPTTSAYSSMLTGKDCFGTRVVALRHKGGMPESVATLPEILRGEGYESTCVGFTNNPASRGFDHYLDYVAWGNWETRPLTKADKLNQVALPEIERLQDTGKPWMMMLRHMDPHSPYLPPAPYDRMFYHGDECDPKNRSLDAMKAFKPFRDYFATWMPPGVTDSKYIDAQYDGAVAYMDACIAVIFHQLESMGILDETIVVLNGDHGETLNEHDCWYDHHGLYEHNLVVPLIIRYPGRLPAGQRVPGYNLHKDLVPTLLDLAKIRTKQRFDGSSLLPLVQGKRPSMESEFYLTECTWMRKHGWRTPEWKLIVALEPDFHHKPPVELYNLREDPAELNNLAKKEPEVVAHLRSRMEAFIARREKQTGQPNPITTQKGWHSVKGVDFFESSDQAYQSLHIGDPEVARRLQAKGR